MGVMRLEFTEVVYKDEEIKDLENLFHFGSIGLPYFIGVRHCVVFVGLGVLKIKLNNIQPHF